MKLGELKVIHLIVAISLILWGYLFFDYQWNKRINGLTNGQIANALNDLNNRISKLEGRPMMMPSPPQSLPKK